MFNLTLPNPVTHNKNTLAHSLSLTTTDPFTNEDTPFLLNNFTRLTPPEAKEVLYDMLTNTPKEDIPKEFHRLKEKLMRTPKDYLDTVPKFVIDLWFFDNGELTNACKDFYDFLDRMAFYEKI